VVPDAAEKQRLVADDDQQRAHSARRELSHGSIFFRSAAGRAFLWEQLR
jgi:hypothetical protein